MLKAPEKLKTLIDQDPKLKAAIELILSATSQWIDDSTREFFPDYTDHGIKHVQAVLDGAQWLISESSWNELTPTDAAVLVAASILHDSAMHLSADGFLQLIDSGVKRGSVGGHFYDAFEDRAWPELWSEYLNEASRFDGKKIERLFGLDQHLPEPPSGNPAEWTRNQRLLIGEFLRRHHARLAHEIAISGVPGPARPAAGFDQLGDELRDVSGFVARSHLLDIRACADKLERTSRQVWRSVHIPFLCCILRVADYLEIDASRAPKSLLSIRKLQSPFSRLMWELHDAVSEIREDPDDPEALFIDASPKNVGAFLELKDLFKGLQDELDSSWATLGEVYGRHPQLSELGLRLRRVSSTLDDVEKFSSKVKWVPMNAKFDVANGEVLKLLVGPLYREQPVLGVRELVQNAVDAVREFEDYSKNVSERCERRKLESDADVVVKLTIDTSENEMSSLTVEDRGIGMTLDTVINYFLRVGSTYRLSSNWAQLHTDVDGESRIARTGRFGVGALAAFLIGDELTIETRHPSNTQGFRFCARLDTDVISIEKIQAPVGTLVRLHIQSRKESQALFERPEDWDWYAAKCPNVKRFVVVDGDTTELDARERFDVESDSTWVKLETRSGVDVFWRWRQGFQLLRKNEIRVLKKGEHGHEPWDVYNGMRLNTAFSHTRDRSCDAGVVGRLHSPRLAIFDRNGLISFDLRRDFYSSDVLPFDDELAIAVARDHIARLLLHTPEVRSNPTLPHGKFPIFELGPTGFRPFLGGAEPFWILSQYADGFAALPGDWPHYVASIAEGANPELHGRSIDQTLLEHLGFDFQHSWWPELQPHVIGAALWCDSSQHDGVPLRNEEDVVQVWQEGEPFEPLERLSDIPHPFVLLGLKMRRRSDLVPPRFLEVWRKVIGDRDIPWSMEARRQNLGSAFEELKVEINRWKDA